MKVVIFDIWNTILRPPNNFDSRKYRYSLLQNTTKIDIDYKNYNKIIEDFINQRIQTNQDLGSRFYAEKLLEELKLEHLSELISEITSISEEAEPEVFPCIKEFLSKLKTKVDKIGIASNTFFTSSKSVRQYLEKQGIISYFDFYYFSEKLGKLKSHSEFFQIVLEKENLDTGYDTVFMIGDSLKQDILPALESDIIPIKFEEKLNSNKLEKTSKFASFGSYCNSDFIMKYILSTD